MLRSTPESRVLNWPTIPEPPPGYDFKDQLRRPRDREVRRFFELKEYPHKIVRELLPISIHRLAQFKQALRRLTDQFGVATPNLDYQQGNWDDTYMITDRVYGLPIQKVGLAVTPLIRDVLTQHFDRMTTYFETIFSEGGDFLTDIHYLVHGQTHLAQYVYGHRKDETEEQLYLVDIEPRFDTFDPQSTYTEAGWDLLCSMSRVTIDTVELADLTDSEPAFQLLERQQEIVRAMIKADLPTPSRLEPIVYGAIQNVFANRLLPIPQDPYL